MTMTSTRPPTRVDEADAWPAQSECRQATLYALELHALRADRKVLMHGLHRTLSWWELQRLYAVEERLHELSGLLGVPPLAADEYSALRIRLERELRDARLDSARRSELQSRLDACRQALALEAGNPLDVRQV